MIGQVAFTECADIQEYLKLLRCMRSVAQSFIRDSAARSIVLYTTGKDSTYCTLTDDGEIHLKRSGRTIMQFKHVRQMSQQIDQAFGELAGSDALITPGFIFKAEPLSIISTYEPVKPPWYWRMIGREYWKGWSIHVRLFVAGIPSMEAQTAPAEAPPNPQLVADRTTAAIQDLLNSRR